MTWPGSDKHRPLENTRLPSDLSDSRLLMGSAIGQVLPTAVGVALSPLPIVAVVSKLGILMAPS
jgi:hypothetical protein